MYVITNYTKTKAKSLGVIVKLSTKKGKKLDVFKDNKLIASVGALGYYDYPTYQKLYGLDYANKRRKLYKIRHNSDRKVLGSNGYWADQLLW